MKTIVKSMINEAPSVGRARELFDHFLSYYTGKIAQISGPYITPNEGHSSLPDYIVSVQSSLKMKQQQIRILEVCLVIKH